MKSIPASLILAAALCAPAFAQDKPEWQGEGSFGAGATTGNTTTSEINAGLKITHTGELWTQTGELSGDYGKTDGVETRNRVLASGQLGRRFSERMSGFARLRYERDEFTGFEHRTFAGLGLSFDVLIEEPTTWTIQGGPGYRWDKDRTTGETEKSLGGSVGSRFKHDFNERVSLTNDTDVIIASDNTQYTNIAAVTFQVIGNLSGRLSYDVRHSTHPPPSFEKTDTATRFSIVYKIG